MTSDYIPDFDGTLELDCKDTQFYQELIGELRWATEIGRVDVLHEVASNTVVLAWINTHENLADVLTKRLPENKRNYLIGNFTY